MRDDTTYPYDVFISYRWVTPDQEWVREELYQALVNAGLKVCLDVEDFIPGRDLILEMERAGQESRHVLCIISPAYFEEGRLSEFESLSARRRDPGGRNSFLIPFIFRETHIPDRIRGLIPITWTDPQYRPREWKKLLRALQATNLAAPIPGDSQTPPPGSGQTPPPAVEKHPGPSPRKDINGIIGSGAFALFIGLIISALQLAGVISLFVAHVLIAAAWVVSVITVFTSGRFRSLFPKHTNATRLVVILIIGIVLLGIDRWMVRERVKQEDHVALPSSPTVMPSQTVANSFNQGVSLQRELPRSLWDLLKENGYSGSMLLQQLMICNSPYNKDEISVKRLGLGKEVNEVLAPGKCYNERAGLGSVSIDASQIILSSSSTVKVFIEAQPSK